MFASIFCLITNNYPFNKITFLCTEDNNFVIEIRLYKIKVYVFEELSFSFNKLKFISTLNYKNSNYDNVPPSNLGTKEMTTWLS